MTMLMTLSCPCRSVSSVHDFNGNLKLSVRTKYAINFAFVTAFPRSRVSRRIFRYNSASCSQGTGWIRWMGGQETLINFGGVRDRRVDKEEFRLGTRWSRETVRSDMFITPNSGNNSWVGKFLKFDKSRGDGDFQKTAVVDVHIRFFLSEPKSLADAASKLAPPWYKLLKRVQPVLPLLQNGGGGNRDGDFDSRLGYGGDDDWDKSKTNRRRKERLLPVYQWWAVAGLIISLVLVCDLIHYGKNLNVVSRVKPNLSRISQLFKSPSVGGASRPASLFSRELSGEKRRRGTSSSAKWRRP